MAAIKKAYFDAPDGQLHYRYLLSTQDAKKPPCVFLHMSASSSRHYKSMMKVHADRGHDCYAPDMPGYVVL
jgi:pimeloyl-ACP methyl ester carboxylesterase